MKTPHALVVLAALGGRAVSAADDPARLQLRTASNHHMQYYVSLPQGWKPGTPWPVVMVIAAADRDFEGNAAAFVRERGAMPFIVVAPMVVTNGGTGYREVPTYRYSEQTWTEVERVGRCRFDVDGILAVASDVKRLYGGGERFFITGWEAGGHTVLTMAFQHPEVLQAAAPSCPNYIGRCMESGGFSSHSSRTELPINVFMASGDPACHADGILGKQADAAANVAREHGYGGVRMTPVTASERGAHPREILAYFLTLVHGK